MSTEIPVDAEGSSGRLFSINISQVGVDPNLTPTFDPGFIPGVGPNGAVLLARVDFETDFIFETIDLEFALGELGAQCLPDINLSPSFGSATLTVGFPKLGFCLGDVNQSGTEENNYLDGVAFFDIAPFIAVLAIWRVSTRSGLQ